MYYFGKYLLTVGLFLNNIVLFILIAYFGWSIKIFLLMQLIYIFFILFSNFILKKYKEKNILKELKQDLFYFFKNNKKLLIVYLIIYYLTVILYLIWFFNDSQNCNGCINMLKKYTKLSNFLLLFTVILFEILFYEIYYYYLKIFYQDISYNIYHISIFYYLKYFLEIFYHYLFFDSKFIYNFLLFLILLIVSKFIKFENFLQKSGYMISIRVGYFTQLCICSNIYYRI